MRIPIIIPSLEPDTKLIQLCKDLKDAGLNDIVVVNDGSSKEYDSIFKEVGSVIQSKILVHPVNKGKGAALKTAFNELLKDDDVIGCITADSDGQHTPKDIQRLMDTFKQNQNALILGVRNFNQENVPFRNKFGNKLSIQLFSILGGVKVSDTQTGLRAIPRNFMKELIMIKEDRFEFETKMLIMTRNKYPIKEITIETVYEEKENYVSHYNPIKDSIKIGKILIKQFLRFIFSSLSSAVLDIVLFTIFVSILKGRDVSLYAAFATIMARVISAIYNYLMNYYFVFQSEQSKSKSFLRYVCLAIVQMACSAILITIAINIFDLHETVMKLVIDTILFFISYQIQKRIVF